MITKLVDIYSTIIGSLKGAFICTLKGHDWCETMCFRCWKWDKTKVDL